jgi:DNA-binding NarL/FixJ family response regulator
VQERPPPSEVEALWRLAYEVCTERELEVLQLRQAGLSFRIIATFLDVAVSTVVDTERRAAARLARARQGEE